jgi:SRSO17 transposase
LTPIHKLTWEPRGHKSIIDYFITNMKTSKVIQDIRVYSSNEIDIWKEWKTLQNILKSAANESLGIIKRRNR